MNHGYRVIFRPAAKVLLSTESDENDIAEELKKEIFEKDFFTELELEDANIIGSDQKTGSEFKVTSSVINYDS